MALIEAKKDKFKTFFQNLWHELEPIVTELIIYSIVILLVAIVGNFTKPYVDEKLRDAIETIKWIVVRGALSLFAFHTISKIFIRMCVGIVLETKEGIEKVRQNKKDNDEELSLNEKPTTFDELEETKNVEKESMRRGRKRKND